MDVTSKDIMSKATTTQSVPGAALLGGKGGPLPGNENAVRDTTNSTQGGQTAVPNSGETLPKGVGLSVAEAVELNEVDDDNESSEEEELPIVQNPSQDIRGDLINALKECKDTTAGPFFSSRSYSAIKEPNPWIAIENFGILSLPLSALEAKRLIKAKVSQQTPKRKRGDKTKSGMWEVDGSKIRFENPAWDTWLADVVLPHVCENLGVDFTWTAPRAELCNLLVYETGSHYPPCQDAPQSPHVFAAMSIVLPSQFSGGSVHLTHGKSRTIDTAADSLSTTHALAWYSGISHSLQPVVSGYRLALSYNLVHTKVFKPTLPPIPDGAAQLRHILLSWKLAEQGRVRSGKKVPGKLCYLLDHDYSNGSDWFEDEPRSKISVGVLKGRDAGLVDQLAPLAAELKFGFFLGIILLWRRGEAYNPAGSRWGYKDNNADNVKFEQIDEETLDFTSVVDLDGMPMVQADNEDDMPIDMNDVIPEAFGGEGSEPDSKEYEEYDGYHTLEHRFYRSALILCPDRRFFEIGNITNYACEILTKCELPKPSRKEKKLARKLAEKCQSGSIRERDLKRTIEVLIATAVRWNNIDLCMKALSACPPVSMLQIVGAEGFVKMYKAFDFKSLETHLSAAIKADESNSRRLSLLNELTRLGNGNDNKTLTEWCKSEHEIVLKTLRQATEEDIELLIQIVKQRGAQVLSDVILPQLSIVNKDVSFWFTFLQTLSREKSGIPPNPDETEAIISAKVSAIMSTASPIPAEFVKARYSFEKDRLEPHVPTWLRYIKLSVLLNRHDLCLAYFKRMVDEYNNATVQSKTLIAGSFIPPAVTGLGAEIATFDPDASSLFGEFFKFALDVYVDRKILQCEGNLDVSTLMTAVKRSGDAEYVIAKLKPAYSLLAQKRPKEAREMLSSLASETRKMASNQPDFRVHTTIIDGLMRSVIGAADLDHSKRLSTMGTASTELSLIKFCQSIGCQSYIPLVLDRILLPKADSSLQTQIANGIIPLLPQLKLFLTSVGQTITHEPYSSFFAKVIKGYINSVLGQKPEDVVTSALVDTVGCKVTECWLCLSYRRFLLAEDRVMSVSRHADIRKHLEAELEKTRSWGVTWTTIRSGSPHTLQITKPDVMIPPTVTAWMNRRAEGRKFVECIGDEAVLLSILGGDFATIASILGIRQRVPVAYARTSDVSGPSSGSSHQASITQATKKRHSTGGSQETKRTKLDSDVIDLSSSP